MVFNKRAITALLVVLFVANGMGCLRPRYRTTPYRVSGSYYDKKEDYGKPYSVFIKHDNPMEKAFLSYLNKAGLMQYRDPQYRDRLSPEEVKYMRLMNKNLELTNEMLEQENWDNLTSGLTESMDQSAMFDNVRKAMGSADRGLESAKIGTFKAFADGFLKKKK